MWKCFLPGMAECATERIGMYEFIKMQEYIKGTSLIEGQRKY